MQKYIIVIRGLNPVMYLELKQELSQQYVDRNMEVPIFANLPGSPDDASIDIVWIDREMELEHLANITKNMNRFNVNPEWKGVDG